MSQLIPFEQRQVGSEKIETVNARDLHAFLQVKQRFNDWIAKRIDQYGFLQDIDFIRYYVSSNENPNAGIEYFLTFDMAKQLSMVERNAKGREARLYFIECERVALNHHSAPIVSPSPDAQLSTIEKALNILDRLGQLTPRDELMYADMTRNVSLSSQRLLASPAAVPSAHGFSVAERCAALGYQLTRKQAATFLPILGKLIAKEYRSQYGMDPKKEPRYVDGAMRGVSWFAGSDSDWIDPIIQGYLAGFPGLTRVQLDGQVQ